MATLRDLQNYCRGKSIIIVGNSSRLLNGRYRDLIDRYEVVVRINRGYQNDSEFYAAHIGSRTNILSIGIKAAAGAANIIRENSLNYILSPVKHSEELLFENCYKVEDAAYDILKNELGGFKPSTGIATYNFFNKYIDFGKLDLIGFDFFESSTKQRNQFGHTYVPDHHGIKELKYFEKTKDSDKTKLFGMIGGNGPSALNTRHNMPIINNQRVNKYTFKKIKR